MSFAELDIEFQEGSFEEMSQSEMLYIYLKKLLQGMTLELNKPFHKEIFGSKTKVTLTDFEPKNGSTKINVTQSTEIKLKGAKYKKEEMESKFIQELNSFYQKTSEHEKILELIQINLIAEKRPVIPVQSVLVQSQTGNGKSLLINQIEQELGQYTQQDKLYIVKAILNEDSFQIEPQLLFNKSILILKDDIQTDQGLENLKKSIQELQEQKCCFMIIASLSKAQKLNQNLIDSIFFKKLSLNVPNTLQRENLIKILLSKITENYSIEKQMENLTLKSDQIQLEKSNEKLDQIFKEKSFDYLTTLVQKTSGFTYRNIYQILSEIETILDKSKNKSITIEIINTAFSSINKTINKYILQFEKVFFQDIGGYSHVKSLLYHLIQNPIKNPQIFIQRGLKPTKGILLYGPPGCSKTMFAKALATESQMNFISIKSPEILDKYVGESEKKIREIFENAWQISPCIIFFDEVDTIATKRKQSSQNHQVSVLNQLLTEIDGMSEDQSFKNASQQFQDTVIVVAATNMPHRIDSAILRPGRFDNLILIDLPDEEAIQQIVQKQLKNFSIEERVYQDFIQELKQKQYSGAEIIQVCKEAIMINVIKQDYENMGLSEQDLKTSIAKVPPRIDPKDIQSLKEFQEQIKI